jgi:hypothetical protein
MFTLIYIVLAFVGGVAVQTFYPAVGGIVLDKAQDVYFWLVDKFSKKDKDADSK